MIAKCANRACPLNHVVLVSLLVVQLGVNLHFLSWRHNTSKQLLLLRKVSREAKAVVRRFELSVFSLAHLRLWAVSSYRLALRSPLAFLLICFAPTHHLILLRELRAQSVLFYYNLDRLLQATSDHVALAKLFSLLIRDNVRRVDGNLSSLALNIGCHLSWLHHNEVVDRVLRDDVCHVLRLLRLV